MKKSAEYKATKKASKAMPSDAEQYAAVARRIIDPKSPRKSKALRERGIHLQSAQGKRDHHLAAAMKDKLRALRKSRSKKSNAVKHTICGVLAKYSKFLGT